MNSSTQETSSEETISAKDSMYNIQVEESLITWTGKELSSKLHYGTINLISGNFEISGGLISKGEFVVDMTTIINQDLPEERRFKLENHLKSEDFFFVESYPEAKISISESEIIAEGKWLVLGELTIKSYTHPIQFEMSNSQEGWKANLVFDRSKYEVRFRSGTFFENLGDKLIYDDIELAINLKTL
jgi:polyisoprenoid-binding protein YceI